MMQTRTSCRCAVLLLALASCGAPSPPPVSVAEAPPAPEDPPPAASSVPAVPVTAASVASPPPPQPPMSLSWTFATPDGFKGTPVSERLEVMTDGTGQFSSFRGNPGEDPYDMFGPDSRRPPLLRPPRTGSKRCDGHVAPDLHRKVVDTALGAIVKGCEKGAPKGAVAATSITVTYDGKESSCPRADLSTTSWGTFETARREVVLALCGSSR